MPEVESAPLQRGQIIAATITCIHRDGLSGASVSRIAREASIAPSLIAQYFEDESALLLEAFRSIYRALTDDIRRRRLGCNAQERVLGVLEARISLAALTPEAAAAWFAICSAMQKSPLLARIKTAFDRRQKCTLALELRALGVGASEADDTAEELSVLIDGLWHNQAVSVNFTSERARRVLYRYLEHRLPQIARSLPDEESAHHATECVDLSAPAQRFLSENLPVVPVHLSAESIVETRRHLAELYRPDAKATAREFGLELTQTRLGNVETLRVSPRVMDQDRHAIPGSDRLPRIFYLFGGGYVTGAPDLDMPVIGPLCAKLQAMAAAPRYRLAPEYPYPAALEDARSAYRALVAAVKGPLWVVGESAGGGLALALLQMVADEGLRMPDAVALLSPWVDLTHGLPSANDGSDPTFTRQNLLDSARLYAGDNRDLSQPGLSPLFGRLSDLPPVLITTGGRDILREQAHALAGAITTAGGSATLHDWPGLWHVFEYNRAMPEAGQSLERIAAFLRRHATRDDQSKLA